MPLGIFASELTHDVGMAMPTYFKNWSSVTESSPYWHMCGTIEADINGNFCAAWIIVNKNMDYLHKQVSW